MENTDIFSVFERTDWRLLAQQKDELTKANIKGQFDGLLNWIDEIQDAAKAHNYPVYR